MADDEITGARGLENIMQLIGVMVPFVSPLFHFQFAFASILQRAIALSVVCDRLRTWAACSHFSSSHKMLHHLEVCSCA